jgi:hypothetical protein
MRSSRAIAPTSYRAPSVDIANTADFLAEECSFMFHHEYICFPTRRDARIPQPAAIFECDSILISPAHRRARRAGMGWTARR